MDIKLLLRSSRKYFCGDAVRFYDIVISDPATGAVVRRYTSATADGTVIPGALQVEFDIPIVAYGSPNSGGYLRIWGVSLKDIGQANDLNNKVITVRAGMSQGLPLANPNQVGIILEGFIFQAYGNWMGVVQTLDLIVIPGRGPDFDSKNFTLNYKKGQQLAPAILSTLQIAYPFLNIDVSGISPDLVIAQDQPGQYLTLQSFMIYLRDMSLSIGGVTATGAEYSGLNAYFKNGTLFVTDNSSGASRIKDISFKDLIGQPTWNDPTSFQFSCVLRGDLGLGDYIRMPPTQFASTPSSFSRFRDNSVFQGLGHILGGDSSIRHVGNSRQPDGQSWITTVNCVALFAPKVPAAVEAGGVVA